jgi:hypothetical protein
MVGLDFIPHCLHKGAHMRRTTMPLECELKGVRLAIKTLKRGKGPVWLLPSLKRRERALSVLVGPKKLLKKREAVG